MGEITAEPTREEILAEFAEYRKKYPVPEKVYLRGYKIISPKAVIPAKAGIQPQQQPDSRLRGNDE